MATMDQFGNRMIARAAALRKHRNELIGDLGTNVLRQIAIHTPHDTGRARSNWLVTLDKRSDHSYYSTNYGGPFGAQNAIARGTPVAMSYRGEVNNSLHITNNLLYIGKLNEGSSSQAPARYVQTAMGRAILLTIKRRTLIR